MSLNTIHQRNSGGARIKIAPKKARDAGSVGKCHSLKVTTATPASKCEAHVSSISELSRLSWLKLLKFELPAIRPVSTNACSCLVFFAPASPPPCSGVANTKENNKRSRLILKIFPKQPLARITIYTSTITICPYTAFKRPSILSFNHFVSP